MTKKVIWAKNPDDAEDGGDRGDGAEMAETAEMTFSGVPSFCT